jgi:hypothetical protein
MKTSMQRVTASKAGASGDKLGFGFLLDYSRRLEYSDQMPCYARLKRLFTDLNRWEYPSPRSIIVLRLLTVKMTRRITKKTVRAMKRRISQTVTSTGILGCTW